MTRAALALLCALCALVGASAAACGTTELQRKELAIQTALDGAFFACQTALNDPRMEWEPGARDYCLRMLDGCRETGRP